MPRASLPLVAALLLTIMVPASNCFHVFFGCQHVVLNRMPLKSFTALHYTETEASSEYARLKQAMKGSTNELFKQKEQPTTTQIQASKPAIDSSKQMLSEAKASISIQASKPATDSSKQMLSEAKASISQLSRDNRTLSRQAEKATKELVLLKDRLKLVEREKREATKSITSLQKSLQKKDTAVARLREESSVKAMGFKEQLTKFKKEGRGNEKMLKLLQDENDRLERDQHRQIINLKHELQSKGEIEAKLTNIVSTLNIAMEKLKNSEKAKHQALEKEIEGRDVLIARYEKDRQSVRTLSRIAFSVANAKAKRGVMGAGKLVSGGATKTTKVFVGGVKGFGRVLKWGVTLGGLLEYTFF